ncbi:MAG: cadherin-like domain-containing protein [Candidatus Omnitrophica bacterium]|nr:cadherin-like domain-containing protein [Candidatus Omnitrophota bacterium]
MTFAVTITVVAGEGTGAYAVEDQPPLGWSVTNINYNGRFDSESFKVKWGPFFDHTSRVLSYQVTPAQASSGVTQFSGQASFNGLSMEIKGVRQIIMLGPSALNQVVSRLPAFFVPTVGFSVTNQASPLPQVEVYAVEDIVPPAWTVTGISHGGNYDPVNHTVKWGPFFDHAERELTYLVTPSIGATNAAHFDGYGSFDGLSVPIIGQRDIAPATSRATRALPDLYQPSLTITVNLAVQPADGIQTYAIEDHPPAGWTVSAINEGGMLDALNGALKWGPFIDHSNRILTYQATAPLTTVGAAVFEGVGSFDGVPVPIGGDHLVTETASIVWRELPGQFLPGCLLAVTNRVVPSETVLVYAVEETVPSGWTISEISDNGSVDSFEHQVKWGPFFDNQPRSLSYVVTSPASAQGVFCFDGRGSFDGSGVAIAGQSSTEAIHSAQASVVERFLPVTWRSGRVLSVTNRTTVASNVSVYAVEDQVPEGWTVGNISHNGSFDPKSRRVKWGLFFDHEPRTLVFEVTPPPSTAGSVLFNGKGSFDGVSVAISGAQSLEAVVNHSPVARADTLEREMDSSIRIRVADLMANDSDSDNDPLELKSLPSFSVLGISLIIDQGDIVYSPPAGMNTADSFDYTISDGYGGSATATVAILSIPPSSGQNIVSIETRPYNVIFLRFYGIPGRTYWIEAADRLDPPEWVTLGSRTASPIGEFSFEDTDAATHTNRFYRTTSAAP